MALETETARAFVDTKDFAGGRFSLPERASSAMDLQRVADLPAARLTFT
jgi:hypothetical protein